MSGEDGDKVTDEVAVRIRGVSHQFGEQGGTRYVRALLDTSLDIRRGELLCLIGPSGCGKSTLLSIMGGLMEPASGTVEVGNQRVRGPMPQEIAFVFQENALFPWSTVLENVKLGMMFQGVRKAEREKRAKLRSTRSGSRISPTTIRASCRAACASAPRWRAP